MFCVCLKEKECVRVRVCVCVWRRAGEKECEKQRERHALYPLDCRVLLSVYRTLLSVRSALLCICRALRSVYRARLRAVMPSTRFVVFMCVCVWCVEESERESVRESEREGERARKQKERE